MYTNKWDMIIMYKKVPAKLKPYEYFPNIPMYYISIDVWECKEPINLYLSHT